MIWFVFGSETTGLRELSTFFSSVLTVFLSFSNSFVFSTVLTDGILFNSPVFSNQEVFVLGRMAHD